MDTPDQQVLKRREINFSPLHPDPNQADSARKVLIGVTGIRELDSPHACCLHIQYDIRHITLRMINEALEQLGFHLDNSLVGKLKRALFYYTEDTERANLGCDSCQGKITTQVFVCHYQRRQHGCRDGRPEHWRRYL